MTHFCCCDLTENRGQLTSIFYSCGHSKILCGSSPDSATPIDRLRAASRLRLSIICKGPANTKSPMHCIGLKVFVTLQRIEL